MAPRLGWLPTPWGAIPLYAWGLSVGLGWVAAWLLTARLLRGQRHLPPHLVEAWLPAGLGALSGAWGLGAVLSLPAALPLDPSSIGALLGALLGALGWLRRRGLRVGPALDALAPGALLAAALVSLGCWFHGCHFGPPLPASAPRWLTALGDVPGLPAHLPASTSGARHPVPLYLTAGLLGGSGWLAHRLHCHPRTARRDGDLLRTALCLWAGLRLAAAPLRLAVTKEPLPTTILASTDALGAALLALFALASRRGEPTRPPGSDQGGPSPSASP